MCCTGSQICCAEQGPVAITIGCYDPVNGTCPKHNPNVNCADPETPIATPSGDVPIAQLRPGDLVYSIDHGSVAIVRVSRVSSAQVVHHHVRHVVLANGRALDISRGHPTADGRTFADLEAGDTFFGVDIRGIEDIPYRRSHTFDILPASDTGTYFASGVLVGSTLASAQSPVPAVTLAAPPR
jgi:hypothetical protein